MALPRFLAAAAVCIILASVPARADEIQEINQQFRNGDLAGALDRANRYLAKNPKDAQARFLKGLILADQGKAGEAIAAFQALSEDFPELPEPYNNLAVLYASQGKYEDAKNALENAVRAHPNYATAHENLGDLYAKMASLAYGKALALDGTNTAAQTKLARIQDMIGGQRKPAAIRPTTEPAAARPAAGPVAAPATPAAPPAPASAEIATAVARWAQAWSARDVEAYLATYADDFAPDGMTRDNWAAQRRAHITAPKRIEIQIGDIRIEQQGDTASARFRQTYRSDQLTSTVTKTLKLALQGGTWRIVGETAQ